MIRKILMLTLTILSSVDVLVLWLGGQHLVAPIANAERNLAYSNTTPSVPAHATSEETDQFPTDPNDPTASQNRWVEIRPADAFLNALTADGTIELVGKHQVVLLVDGVIRQVAVKAGDNVTAGQLLLALDDADLARSVNRATIDLATAQAELQKLQEGSSPGEIAIAEANLQAAQANLTKAQAGPSKAEWDAAQSRLAAAQARYNELQGPPSGAELDEARAEMEKAQIAVQTAQRAYDRIGGTTNPEIGMTQESQNLYQATVELERVQAKYNRVNQGSSQSSLQDGLSNIQKAQADIALLRLRPSASEIADAQAKVTDAEQRLAKLQAGASASELQSAEAKVQKAQLDLEEANYKLQNAQVVAPIDGTLLEVSANPGERGATGKVVATLANTQDLKLTVKVAEVDVTKISVGQVVSITLDALRDRSFNGIIESIAPINQENKDVVNYPVTIRLTDSNLASVRPGMTAQARLTPKSDSANSWLAPQNALRQQRDGSQVVKVQRGEKVLSIKVTPSATHGEMIVLESAALQAGDVVEVSSEVEGVVGG